MFVRVLTESTEKELRAIGHYLPNQTAGNASYYMVRPSLTDMLSE